MPRYSEKKPPLPHPLFIIIKSKQLERLERTLGKLASFSSPSSVPIAMSELKELSWSFATAHLLLLIPVILMGFSEGKSLIRTQYYYLNHREISPESLLISSHLTESSNENEILRNEDTGSFRDAKKNKPHPNLPSYLELIDTQLQTEYSTSTTEDAEAAGPFVRAWFPTSLTRSSTYKVAEEEGSSYTLLLFQQNQPTELIRHFVKAEFVLSLKSDAASTLGENDLLVRLQVEQNTYVTQLRPQDHQHLITFNLTSLLSRYMKSNQAPSELTFNVTLSTNANSFYIDEIFDSSVDKPGILLYYKNSHNAPTISQLSKRRSKRSVESPLDHTPNPATSCYFNCSSSSYNGTSLSFAGALSNSTHHLCRRVEWSVSVEDIDWAEVVSHRKLELGYCAGDCPFPLENEQYNFTLHSYFLDKFKRNKHSEIPSDFPRRSCCIPVTYHPIRVWVEEEPSVYGFIQYDNVRVDSCGCR